MVSRLISATAMAPATAVLLRRNKRTNTMSRFRAGGPNRLTGVGFPTSEIASKVTKRRLLLVSYPGIQPRVGNIDRQIQHDVHHCREQYDTLNKKVVLVEDGLQRKAPHALPSKDRLYNDGSAQKPAG